MISILAEIETDMQSIIGFGVKRIGLFGSFAREEQTNSSDIDVLVEFHQEQKKFEIFLEDLFERKVDLVIAETIKPELKPDITGSVQYAQGL